MREEFMANVAVLKALDAWDALTQRLRGAAEVVPLLVMRIVMGWEFWESGTEKLRGQNWFADIQDRFPAPFDAIPAAVSWQVATWFEIVGAVATNVSTSSANAKKRVPRPSHSATAAVHWPDVVSMWSDLLKGYAISDKGYGNYKLPLLFSVMLLPLVFNGAGKLSLDHLLATLLRLDSDAKPIADAYAWSLAALVLGVPFLMLVPTAGLALLAIALVLALFGRYARA
jgi:putative oxidoreductase